MAKLIEPAIARAVARRVAGRGVDDPGAAAALRADLERALPTAHDLVAAHSGIPAPEPVPARLIGRAAWADANIAGMGVLLGPLGDKIGHRLDAAPFALRVAQRAVVSAEMGAVLGYIARRVLGQYDLLVTEGGPAPRRGRPSGALYFVEPNLIETQRRLRFEPRDFVLWVGIHEVTHRFQFAGVPWLQPRFLGLVRSYMETVDLDAKGLAARLATAGRRLASRSVPPEERSPAYLLATDEQREILDRIQALMAVVEGHGNFVMDAAAARTIPTFERMRAAFDRRRTQMSLAQRLVSNVLGLEMKLRQYEMGQRFCEAVAARHGASALELLWAAEDNLPSLVELQHPEGWMRRVA